MAERDSHPPQGLIERLGLAAVGALALSTDRMQELAERWRGDATTSLGERAPAGVHRVLGELGLVTREDIEELELRIAQIEHRLRLLEGERVSD